MHTFLSWFQRWHKRWRRWRPQSYHIRPYQTAPPPYDRLSTQQPSAGLCRLALLQTAHCKCRHTHTYIHTHTRLTALCPGLPRSASTRKVKPIWILLKKETVSGSGISWAICKWAPRSRQITTQAPHHSVFYRLDALPAAQPTVSKHWRETIKQKQQTN